MRSRRKRRVLSPRSFAVLRYQSRAPAFTAPRETDAIAARVATGCCSACASRRPWLQRESASASAAATGITTSQRSSASSSTSSSGAPAPATTSPLGWKRSCSSWQSRNRASAGGVRGVPAGRIPSSASEDPDPDPVTRCTSSRQPRTPCSAYWGFLTACRSRRSDVSTISATRAFPFVRCSGERDGRSRASTRCRVVRRPSTATMGCRSGAPAGVRRCS